MKRPLVIHVADRQMEEGIKAFFQRAGWHHKLGCQPFEFSPESPADLFRVPRCTDPGLYQGAWENLRAHQRTHERAIVVIDSQFPGSPGNDDEGAEAIRTSIRHGLITTGWNPDHVEVAVIQPMLEAWLWTNSTHVETAFRHVSPPTLRERMLDAGLWREGASKPHDLKEATAMAARWGGLTSDAALFRRVFGSARTLADCVEPGFNRMRTALQTWFPFEGGAA
jgi:hypothetical protein